MDRNKIGLIKQKFDHALQTSEEVQVEFWYARDLMPLFGYEKWENFEKAVRRSMESCNTSGVNAMDHFREVTKMITIGKGGQRNVRDYMSTRYACYLIAQKSP